MVRNVAMVCLHTNPLDQPGTGSSGGMNVYVRSLARALAETDVEVDIYTRAHGTLAVTAIAPGVRVIAVPAGAPGPVPKAGINRLVPALTRAIAGFAARDDREYDLVHSHYWVSGLAGTVLATNWSVPHVHMFHTLSRLKTRYAGNAPDEQRAAGEQQVLDAVDAVVTANQIEARQLRQEYRARGTRITMIPCGVDLNPFMPHASTGGSARQETSFTIVALGRAERLKHFDLLLHAVAEARRRDPRFAQAVQVRIAGGPSNDEPAVLPELRRLARALGLAEHVQFVGPIPHEQTAVFYRAADVCAVPSRYESFGLVAVEAMACGRPVVAARTGGLQVTVEDGVNGYLVDPDDSTQMAERLLTLWACPSLRAKLGAAGLVTAQHYAWPVIAERMRCLYETMAAESVPATA
jgi:D-inositol-3-phosphate glycosyltransferase